MSERDADEARSDVQRRLAVQSCRLQPSVARQHNQVLRCANCSMRTGFCQYEMDPAKGFDRELPVLMLLHGLEAQRKDPLGGISLNIPREAQ